MSWPSTANEWNNINHEIKESQKRWFKLVAICLRKRALQMALKGHTDIADRMLELAEIEEDKALAI